MENASKALIIAGAILISILLVSLAIIMFNNSKGTTQQASDTASAIEKGATAEVEKIEEQLKIEDSTTDTEDTSTEPTDN